MRTIGFLSDQECRKTWHTKSTEMFHLQYVDHVEEILWRPISELLNLIMKQQQFVLIIIYVYDKYYLRKSATCCNLFAFHQRKVKGNHTITLSMTKTLETLRVSAIPAQRFCRNRLYKVGELERNEESSSVSSQSSTSKVELDLQEELRKNEES